MKSKPAKSLGLQGKRLWAELTEQYDLSGLEQLLVELCAVRDRLGEVRAEVARVGIADAGQLLNVEAKLSGQYRMLWRSLGLSDGDTQPARIGRPPGTGAAR